MRLRTKVEIKEYPFQIDHSMRGLMLGSCFTEEIGQRLQTAKFPLVLNPHGVLFNPISIAKTYKALKKNKIYEQIELVQHNGMWHSMDHHGSFSATTAERTLSNINQNIDITDIDYIIITLGSAWVYEFQGEVVANCHKIPSSEFKRVRLSVQEVVESLEPIVNSGLPLILTVSPVRHIKDGLAENALSKAILRVASSILTESYQNVHYFPSYEVVIDELRDYRFYAEDMLHPSKLAVDYIWELFSRAFLGANAIVLTQELENIKSAMEHRSLHPESDEYRKFRRNMLAKVETLSAKYPDLDFSKERDFFTKS